MAIVVGTMPRWQCSRARLRVSWTNNPPASCAIVDRIMEIAMNGPHDGASRQPSRSRPARLQPAADAAAAQHRQCQFAHLYRIADRLQRGRRHGLSSARANSGMRVPGQDGVRSAEYGGTINKVGVDIGYTKAIHTIWRVHSLGSDRGPSDLSGTYVGEQATSQRTPRPAATGCMAAPTRRSAWSPPASCAMPATTWRPASPRFRSG